MPCHRVSFPSRFVAILAVLMTSIVPSLAQAAPVGTPTVANACGQVTVPTTPTIEPFNDKPNVANDGAIPTTIVADGLDGHPTAVAFGPDGTLYVAVTYAETYPLPYYAALFGRVYAVKDGKTILMVDGLHNPTGLTVLGDSLYIATLDSIIRVSGIEGARCSAIDPIVENLPFDESHWTNGVTAHDGRIYAITGYVYRALGSSRRDLRGTVWSFAPDGSDQRIEATGFRNSYALAFDDKGGMWASDNAPNAGYDPGVIDEKQVYPDDLNHIVPGGDYGFHPESGAITMAIGEYIATPVTVKTCITQDCGTPPVLSLGMHTAPTGIVWSDARGQILVGLSSWGQVVAYDPSKKEPVAVIWNLNIPTGIVIGPDGKLYIAEWAANRVIAVPIPAS
jgi:glucose/arabinose dehydrogenase